MPMFVVRCSATVREPKPSKHPLSVERATKSIATRVANVEVIQRGVAKSRSVRPSALREEIVMFVISHTPPRPRAVYKWEPAHALAPYPSIDFSKLDRRVTFVPPIESWIDSRAFHPLTGNSYYRTIIATHSRMKPYDRVTHLGFISIT